ncbi:MAG TPA: tyrosine-type recombinase/integrase [Syntrophorhabdus sp.]|jgi:integrase|nr:tyrosine-type recombinase/integrase [Syntrophorhabdus sp.]
MAKRIQSKYPGVRYREHATRKHGVQKDKYFFIRYQKDKNRIEEGLGWASQGVTAEKAFQRLCELKQNATTGEGPTRLAEKRKIALAKAKQKELENLTVEDFFNKTYFPQAKEDKKEKTCTSEDQFFRLWISPAIGNKPMEKVSPLDIERIKKSMTDAGRSPRSIQYCLAVIRQVFNVARKLDMYSADNPVSKVSKPKFDNRRLRFLSYEETETLLYALAIKSTQLHDMALLSLHCGLRAGEIFNLTWSDINFARSTLTLRDTKSSRTRIAFMTQQVKEMLQERSKATSEERQNDYVFLNRKGHKVKEISNSFDRVVSATGLNNGITDPRQKLTFHGLRHTYASWLVESGVSIYVVKEMLGHQSTAMSERYSHIGHNSMRDAVKTLEKSLNKEQPDNMAILGENEA